MECYFVLELTCNLEESIVLSAIIPVFCPACLFDALPVFVGKLAYHVDLLVLQVLDYVYALVVAFCSDLVEVEDDAGLGHGDGQCGRHLKGMASIRHCLEMDVSECI